jgi:hypothetical protein
MSKETEELVGVAILAFFVLTIMNSSGASATQLATITAQTNLGYANAASSAISSLAGAFD